MNDDDVYRGNHRVDVVSAGHFLIDAGCCRRATAIARGCDHWDQIVLAFISHRSISRAGSGSFTRSSSASSDRPQAASGAIVIESYSTKMRLALFILVSSHIQLVQPIICLSADSKFGHGCVAYNSYAYNTRPYNPYAYSHNYRATPYQYARQPYQHRQPYHVNRRPAFARLPQQYSYRSYPQQYYSSYYNFPYSQPYTTTYNYGYARDHSYSYSGATRDGWGNTYVGSRNNQIWITCRTRYCSG